MIAGVLLLFILLALGPIASKIPAAVLSGILITVGIGVMDYKGLKAIPILPKDIFLGPVKLSSEVLIMIIVLLLSTFWDLIFAVGIGLLISCLMFMKLIGDLTAERSEVGPLKEEAWPDEIDFPKNLKDKVLFKESYCVNDFVNDYNSYKGNAYGLANTLFQTAFLRPKIKSKKVKNLFFTGQLTVPGPGVPPSLISGKLRAYP